MVQPSGLILTGPLATGRAMARHRLKEQRDRRDQPYCAINVIDIIDMILYSYHAAETKRDTHVADRWRAQLKLRKFEQLVQITFDRYRMVIGNGD